MANDVYKLRVEKSNDMNLMVAQFYLLAYHLISSSRREDLFFKKQQLYFSNTKLYLWLNGDVGRTIAMKSNPVKQVHPWHEG